MLVDSNTASEKRKINERTLKRYSNRTQQEDWSWWNNRIEWKTKLENQNVETIMQCYYIISNR